MDDAAPLQFAEGIPGFAGCRSFHLTDLAPDSAFQLLECVDDPDVSIVVTVPWTFFPEYAPVVDDEAQEALGLDSPDDAVVFCPVTLGEDDTVFVNLLGPFVVNVRTRLGRQLVLDGDQPLRAPVRLVA